MGGWRGAAREDHQREHRPAHVLAGWSDCDPDLRVDLSALQGGELRANCVATLVKAKIPGVNGGNPIVVLLHCYGAPLQVAPATQSNHALNRAAADARYAALAGLATQAFDVGPPTNGASAVNLTEFFASLTANCWVKIPVIASGIKPTLVIQWVWWPPCPRAVVKAGRSRMPNLLALRAVTIPGVSAGQPQVVSQVVLV
ncbi:hypothetical protein LJR296_002793 [Cupriavidus necator]|uniref:hypothetical protein n=1 Tax=Cupriavidus necator TaxID=106590 RepID=UPI003ED13655